MKNSPHGTKQQQKQLQQNYAVAFLDILGYSAFLEKATNRENDVYYSRIQEGIDDVMNLSEFKSPFPYQKDFVKKSNLIIRVFSDNILLAIKQTGNITKDIENYQNFLFLVICIQNSFLTKHQLLLRGSVTIGKFIASNNIVFGKALVRAVQLEKEAKYPRVIVDNKDVERFYKITERHKNDKNNSEKYTRMRNSFLLLLIKDRNDTNEEIYFTNYFISGYVNLINLGFMEFTKDYLGITKPHKLSEKMMILSRDSIIKIIEKDGENPYPSVQEKLLWLLEWFNFSCSTNPDVMYLQIKYYKILTEEGKQSSIRLEEEIC